MIDEVDAPPEEAPQGSGDPWMVRIVVVLAVVGLLVVLTNIFSSLEARATASGGGVEATVTYAVVARRGEVVPLKIDLRGVPGTDEPVTVWIRDSYLDELEQFGWSPAPTETVNGSGNVGVFFPNESGALVIELDARLLPTTTLGNHELTLMVETEVGELDFLLTTLVFP